MLSALPLAARPASDSALSPAQVPTDVDPVLVGLITVMLLLVFMFFLLIRRTIKSFTEGMREGRKR